MIPICRTCCVTSAEIVLTMRNALKHSASRPRMLNINMTVCTMSSSGNLSIEVETTVKPLRLALASNASITAFTCALSPRFVTTRCSVL